jgi:hypothetical protein
MLKRNKIGIFYLNLTKMTERFKDNLGLRLHQETQHNKQFPELHEFEKILDKKFSKYDDLNGLLKDKKIMKETT